MRHATLLLVLLVLLGLAAPVRADPPRAPLGLKGSTGVVTPPSGTWLEKSETLAAGQWYVEYRTEDGAALVRAHVFPVRNGARPESVLVQAVDVFFRGLGVGGFGVPSRRALDVWGCPGAEGAIVAVVDGARVAGRARIVRLGKHQWGLAIGYARTDAPVARRDAVTAFVASLEPARPVFYERRFHTPKAYERLVVRVPGDEPLTAGQLAAVERMLEASVGSRFPLALYAPVREALVADGRKGTAKTREGYRATARALEAARAYEPEKRRRAMRALGRRILDAILERANLQYEPAVKFALAWKEFRELRVGTAEDGLTAGDLANRIEMSEFLASLAGDRPLRAEGKTRDAMVLRTYQGWTDVPAEERAGWRDVGTLWSALRYAWDHATPARRFALRRAVAARLAPPQQRDAIEALADERALKRWMMDNPREDKALLDAAYDLSLAERRALIDVLGVEDAYGFHVGW